MAPELVQPGALDPVQPAALDPVQPVAAEPLQPSEAEAVQAASSSHDYFSASEQAAAPPPAPEPITEPEPVEATQPEVQPVTLTPPPPEPVEAPAVVIEAAAAELPSIADVPVMTPEPVLVDEPMAEPSIDQGELGSTPGAFRVIVRLSDGDGVEVGEFRDFGTAMHGAQEVIEQFASANGTWPFYAGRFIRPDLIISVDVVDGV